MKNTLTTLTLCLVLAACGESAQQETAAPMNVEAVAVPAAEAATLPDTTVVVPDSLVAMPDSIAVPSGIEG